MKRLLWWLPTVLYAALIISMAVRPAPDLPGRHVDKVIHFFIYALLAFFCYNSFRAGGLSRPAGPAVVLAVLVGALDESLQALGGVRTPSLLDLLADGLGAGFGGTMTRLLFKAQRES